MKQIHLLLLLSILSSCATISYTPKISLDVSPKRIDKTVKFEKLENLSPTEDTEVPFSGVAVTNPKSLSNSLDVEVTNAIVSDFHTNAVFKNVGRSPDSPDFIIKGSIKRFYGKSQLNNFAKITWGLSMASLFIAPATGNAGSYVLALPILTWYFGMPVQKNSSEIEITLHLYDNKNQFIKTYTAKSYNEEQTNMYNNQTFAVPTLTNKTFSNTIMNIREQIIKDKDLLEQ